MDGLLLINKPTDITSYDVIRVFKRFNKPTYKVGHGGTLDPFASGVLILLLGKATKLMNELSNLRKSYLATAVIGAKSDTLDLTGNIIQLNTQINLENIAPQIKAEAKKMIGQYQQIIPDYSAAKIDGVPRYKLARIGSDITPKSKEVQIDELNIVNIVNNKVVFETKVSSGTYVRQLSYDLFKKMDLESYLTELVRTQIGDFSIKKCIDLKDLETGAWTDKVIPV